MMECVITHCRRSWVQWHGVCICNWLYEVVLFRHSFSLFLLVCVFKRTWFLRNGLQLNANKSQVMILGITPAQLRSAAAVSVVDVTVTTLPVSSQLKSLGVIIDSHMRFDSHVGAVVRACNYHTRALRHVRKHLTTETAQTIVWSVILSRIVSKRRKLAAWFLHHLVAPRL